MQSWGAIRIPISGILALGVVDVDEAKHPAYDGFLPCFDAMPESIDDDEKWEAGAEAFAKLHHALVKSTLARLQPRLVVVEPKLLSRIGRCIAPIERRASFNVLDMTVEQRRGAKKIAVTIPILIVSTQKFQFGVEAWTFRLPQTLACSAIAQRQQKLGLFPALFVVVNAWMVEFGPPVATLAVRQARAREFGVNVWSTGMHPALGKLNGAQLDNPSFLAEPYFHREQNRAIHADAWKDAVRSGQTIQKRTLIVAPIDFCAILAVYLVSLTDPERSTHCLFASEWMKALNNNGERATRLHAKSVQLFPNAECVFRNE